MINEGIVPHICSPNTPKTRKPINLINMLLDQAGEFQKASTKGLFIDLIDEELGELMDAVEDRDDEECQLKELADIVYSSFQLAWSQNWDLEEALQRVHESNLTKIPPDGRVRRRDDGKILKLEGYRPPDLSDLVR
ncbi:hypothetical protein OMCYN_01659 [cyanobiont of Ornithocercus magnificus]|nr:hypothetical protein OMCYN_01659 [cyanobiont of Ornithocercus magnificus]